MVCLALLYVSSFLFSLGDADTQEEIGESFSFLDNGSLGVLDLIMAEDEVSYMKEHAGVAGDAIDYADWVDAVFKR